MEESITKTLITKLNNYSIILFKRCTDSRSHYNEYSVIIRFFRDGRDWQGRCYESQRPCQRGCGSRLTRGAPTRSNLTPSILEPPAIEGADYCPNGSFSRRQPGFTLHFGLGAHCRTRARAVRDIAARPDGGARRGGQAGARGAGRTLGKRRGEQRGECRVARSGVGCGRTGAHGVGRAAVNGARGRRRARSGVRRGRAGTREETPRAE